MREPCFDCHAPAHKRPCGCDTQAEIARLQAEVERLSHALEVSERGSLGNKLQREIAQVQRDRAWNDAIDAAASVCDSKSGTPMDVKEPEYYTALGYELAAEDIRALKRT